MKVIVISSCYPRPDSLNSGVFVHQQIKALQALGAECHVLQPVNWFPPLGLHRLHLYWKSGFQQLQNSFENYEGIKIHHPRVFIKMPSRLFKDHPWDVEGHAVANYILGDKDLRNADLLYAQFLIHEGYVGTVVKKKTGIPLVSLALGDDIHAWPEKYNEKIPYLKKALYDSDLVLANSKGLARDAEAWANEDDPIRVQTVYSGIDIDKFSPVNAVEKDKLKQRFKLESSKKYLLCVATPVLLKGWTNLLDSIQFLDKSFENWQLLMVAPKREGPDALDLEQEADRRGIGRLVKYFSKVAHADMPDLMRAVDVFVLPSHNEGLSNAVLEAMASGLPVLTTDVGGHKEVIQNNVNGILISPDSTPELTSSLRKLLSDTNYRHNLSKYAREGVMVVGSYEHNARKLFSIFKNLVQHNH